MFVFHIRWLVIFYYTQQPSNLTNTFSIVINVLQHKCVYSTSAEGL